MKKKFKYDVCIVGGLGHVGLPLGILFASKGLKVCLNDKNEKISKIVGKGIMPFKEKKAEPLLKKVLKNNHLSISIDPQSISNAKHVIITIGTPINKKNKPATKEFIQAIRKISSFLDSSQIIIIRSSVYPGMCKAIYNLLKKKKIENIAYCPERIKQGYSIQELKELPQIISGFTKIAIKESSSLFKKISSKIIISSVNELELMKLFTNAWRYIQFAIANEYFMICEDLGINYEKIRKIMINDYNRAKNIPQAGFAAGPCLYKDTLQLSHFYKKNFLFGSSAVKINDNLPKFVVKKLLSKYNLKKMTVGILGMAFKANSDDLRDSLSLKLRKILFKYCKKVLCSDEYVKDRNFISKEKLIQQSDIIIIGVPHDQYRKLNIKQKIIINIWDNKI